MKKVILLAFIVTLIGCSPKINNKEVTIHDLAKDFPTYTEAEYCLKDSFDILSKHHFIAVEDSVLWLFADAEESYGSCYNLNTGDKISTIINKGRAKYEAVSLISGIQFLGDTVYVKEFGHSTGIRAYLKKEILDNIPPDRRKLSIINPFEFSNYFFTFPHSNIILSDGSIFIQNRLVPERDTTVNNRFAIYDKGKITRFGELYEVEEFMSVSDVRKISPAKGLLAYQPDRLGMIRELRTAIYNADVLLSSYNDRVAAVNRQGVMLEIIDPYKKEIVRKRYYNKMCISSDFMHARSSEPYNIYDIKCSEKYIYCLFSHLKGYDHNKKCISEQFILVFDWKLKPIKKIKLPDIMFASSSDLYDIVHSKMGFISDITTCFSEDCRYFYVLVNTDNGKKLYECKIDV